MQARTAFQIGCAQYPAQTVIEIAHQPIFGRKDVDVIALAEQCAGSILLRGVVAFGEFMMDEAGGGDEALLCCGRFSTS